VPNVRIAYLPNFSCRFSIALKDGGGTERRWIAKRPFVSPSERQRTVQPLSFDTWR
jgi:hypothetical protein